MSLLTQQTAANTNLFYFVKANGQQLDISTLNANTINSNSISTATIGVSSLVGEFLSTIELDAEYINTSTINTLHVDLDGQILTADPLNLLLNGIPVATLSSLSSIADWSLEPAISSVQMAGYDLAGAGLVSSVSVRAGNGLFNNLVAFNSLFVSSNTSTISSLINSADLGIFSTLNATNADISGLFVSSINGLPISSFETQSTISTFVDLTTSTLNATIADISGLVVSSINGLPISVFEPQSTISTFVDLTTSTLNATIADISGLVVSSINGLPISVFEPQSTISTFVDLTTSTLNANTISTGSIISDSASTSTLLVSTLNGIPYIPGSNWSAYPATQDVNMNGFSFTNVDSIVGDPSTDLIIVNSTSSIRNVAYLYYRTAASYVSTAGNGGIDITTPGSVQLGAVNGLRGQITLKADTGFFNNGGRVDINALGGVTPLGVSYGGLVNIEATTGSFTSLAFTSAIDIAAAGVNSYAGAIPIFGSLTGYNFIHGDLGVNLTAGAASFIPSDPLCVYLYGLNGTLMFGTQYMGRIRPYSDLTTNPTDLYIESYSNLITKGYIQLRGVSTQTFEGGDTAILGVNRIQFSTAGGALENVSSLNGNAISIYENASTFTDASISSLFVSSINGLNVASLENISSFSEITTSSLTASTISTDTLFGSTIQAVGVLADTLLVSTISATTGAKILFDPTGVIVIDSASGGSSLSLVPVDVVVIEGANTGLITSSISGIQSLTAETTSISSIVASSITGVQQLSALNATTSSIVTSSISTAYIYGANDNLFGLGIQGLEIQTAPTGQVWISSPQTNIAGLLNTSTTGARRIQAGEGWVSSLAVSSLTADNLSSIEIQTSSLSINGTLVIPAAASFFSRSTQQVAANTPLVLWHEFAGASVGSSITQSTTSIVIGEAGVYDIETSIQFDKSGGGITAADFWFRKNGVDIPDSASQITIQGNTGECLGNVSIFETFAAGDALEVVIASADNTLAATFFESTITTPYTRPAVPAIITNIKRLG